MPLSFRLQWRGPCRSFTGLPFSPPANVELVSHRIRWCQGRRGGQAIARVSSSKEWAHEEQVLKGELGTLAKYRSIVDAEAKAAEILDTARVSLSDAESKAKQLKASAELEAEKLTDEARIKSRALHEQAQAALDLATRKAMETTEEAKKRAQEIAGGAYEAMNKATLYEDTVKAMRNIIEGYGDRYIVPAHGIIDDGGTEPHGCWAAAEGGSSPHQGHD